MRTIETKVYTFDELSEEAKEKARAWYREGALDYPWYDSVYEDAKTVAKLMGLDIHKIYFSGFWSQGDGACFDSSFHLTAGALDRVKAYAPEDEELHRTAAELDGICARSQFGVEGRTRHSGRYYHSGCMFIDSDGDYIEQEDEDRLSTSIRSFADWIYSRLEDEYDYLNSDEQVDEMIRVNEYEFTKEGEIA